jgi:DNA-binding CsgD family transcriptional regulator
VGDYLEDTIVVSVMLYCFVVGVIYIKKVQDSFKKQLARKFSFVFGIFLPGIVNDTFLSEKSYIRFYPLLYCSLSIIFTYQFLKHHQELKHSATENESAGMLPDDTFFEQYNISAREKDVIALIVQGHSNQQIGDDLRISLNTVKTHVRNIYQKFEINSRQELLALLSDHPAAQNDVAKPSHHASQPDIPS